MPDEPDETEPFTSEGPFESDLAGILGPSALLRRSGRMRCYSHIEWYF